MKYPKVRDVLNELKWVQKTVVKPLVLPTLDDVTLIVADRIEGVKYIKGADITRIGAREFDVTTTGEDGLSKVTTIPNYKVLVIRTKYGQIWERGS